MKKTLAIFAILLMAFSSLAFAEGEEAAPPSEPAPAEAPSEPAPVEAPSELTEAPPTEPNLPPALPPGEQPVPPQVPSGPGGEPGSGGQPSEPSSGGEGGSMPPATGPGNGGCWVGENQVLCPGEGQGPNQGMQPQQPGTNFMNPQNIPPGCKQVNNNGMINIVCDNAQRAPEQMTCTPGDVRERIEKECAAKGGRVVTRNIDSSQGCGIVDCVFGQQGTGNFMPGQQQQCLGPDELAKKEESCRSMGLNPKRMRSSCEYVQCEDPNKQKRQMECPDNHAEWERVGMDCQGKVVKAFDQNGCNIPKCVTSGEQCSNDVPQEAYFKCEDQGGKLVVNTDENGCITFSKCVKRGEEGVEAEDDIDEMPPAAKLLQVALKLESIKISFDQMAKQIMAIAAYYENENDMANAERFQRASGMFESAKKQIDGVKDDLKLGTKGMSVEQIIDIKHKIRQISDVVMEDALYVILGGEDAGSGADYEYKPVERGEEFEGYVPESEKECREGMCFEKAFRICEKAATFSPESNVNLKIVGIDGSACIIKGSVSTPAGRQEMSCKFTDYATMPMSKEAFLFNCEGEMMDFLKQDKAEGNVPRLVQPSASREQAFQGQMMGCEKVEKGINQKGVCGNECCEQRYGESNYNCPNDCMASQQQQFKGQEFVQKAQQAFKQDGEGGCADEISGESPKDVCGNECCEPREDRSNCPADCQGGPMPDEGRFFSEQTGPMESVQQMPQQQWIAPQEPANPPRDYVEPASSESTTTEEAAATETSSGGSVVTGAFVAIDLLKEFLGR